MSEEARNKLRLADRLRGSRGVNFIVYDTTVNGLIHRFLSKQLAYDTVGLDRKTINACLDTGKLCFGRFILSTVELPQYGYDCELSLSDLNALLKEARTSYKQSSHPNTKAIYAHNVLHPNLSSAFVSLTAFANHVKGDRGSIRPYINSNKFSVFSGTLKNMKRKKGLYRNQ